MAKTNPKAAKVAETENNDVVHTEHADKTVNTAAKTDVGKTTKRDKKPTVAKHATENKDDEAAKKESLLIAAGREILESYPVEKEVFVTSDGFGFFNLNEAVNHAKILRNETIVTITK